MIKLFRVVGREEDFLNISISSFTHSGETLEAFRLKPVMTKALPYFALYWPVQEAQRCT